MKTYRGGCHCGQVQYEVTGQFESGMTCNCSICSRAGWVLVFAPKAQFRLLKGEGATTDYQFGKRHTHHPFCSTCGVRSFGHGAGPDGVEMVSVNARCLEDFDLASLEINAFDGASM